MYLDDDNRGKNPLLKRLKLEKIHAVYVLVESLKKYGVTFNAWDGQNENVVFEGNEKEYKIAHSIFYRLGGKCVYAYETGLVYHKAKLVGVKEFTDAMFYQEIKTYVLFALGIEKT